MAKTQVDLVEEGHAVDARAQLGDAPEPFVVRGCRPMRLLVVLELALELLQLAVRPGLQRDAAAERVAQRA